MGPFNPLQLLTPLFLCYGDDSEWLAHVSSMGLNCLEIIPGLALLSREAERRCLLPAGEAAGRNCCSLPSTCLSVNKASLTETLCKSSKKLLSKTHKNIVKKS